MCIFFLYRCNALDFKDLEDRMQRPIIILQDVTFHRSRLDQFIDVFRQQVELNPRYTPIQVCIICEKLLITVFTQYSVVKF